MTVEQLRWARIGTGTGSDAGAGGSVSAGHKHAFWRDGTEKRFVEVEVARKRDGDGAVARVAGGLRDLLGALMSRLFPPAQPIPCLDVHGRGFHTQLLIDSYCSAQVDRIGIREFCAG